MKKLLSIIFAMFLALPTMAMDITVTVWDSDANEPLAYATVQQKGTSKGATTNNEGVANLTVSDDATIVVSYMGYEKMEQPASANMRFDMKNVDTLLDEINIVACSKANGIKTVACEKCTDPEQCEANKCSGTCVVKACHDPCYKLKNGKCELQKTDGGEYSLIKNQCTLTCLSISGYAPDPKDQWKCTQDCTSSITDKNVKHAKYRGSANPNNVKCEIDECKGKYHPSDDKQSCIPDQGDCTPEQLAAIHASEGYLITRENKCVPKKCISEQYKKEGSGDDTKCVDQVGKPCKAKNAASAKYEMQNGKLVCVIETCNNGYKPSDNKCSRDCTAEAQKTNPQAKKAEYDDKNVCQITDCNDDKNGKKYVVVDNKCVEKERDCTDAELKAMNVEGATAGTWSSKKGACTPTACATPQYDPKPKGGKCVSVDDSDCDTKPTNSKKSHQKYDEATGTVQCIVDECQDGYRPADDGLSCILEKALEKTVAEERMRRLKENAQEMKDREQSMENKLLGAAGIGATGIGGKNIASALAEKNADSDAEEDMKAYLATFRCDYGQGRNIVGGETNIELPGGNDLLTYTTEYKQLAQNLKIDKESLGMTPGIESEVVFDKTETGLYDNVGIGTQPGAFTSLSRALLDENSADAKAWQEQKDATAKKLKTGLVVAGVGAVGSLAGNLAINHGKGDQSGKIWNEYEGKKEPIDISPSKIPCSQIKGTTGSGYSPNCECTGNAYFSEKDGCVMCGDNKKVNEKRDDCICADGFHPVENSETLQCVRNQSVPSCELSGYVTDNCTCQDGAKQDGNQCICKTGYRDINNICTKCNLTGLVDTTNPCDCIDHAMPYNGVCKCITDKYIEQNGACVPKPQDIIEPITPNNPINFSADNNSLFKPGTYQIEPDQCSQLVQNLKTTLQSQPEYVTWLNNQQNSNQSDNICIEIIGHADHQWFMGGVVIAGLGRKVPRNDNANKTANEEYSKLRANEVQKCLAGHQQDLFGAKANPTYKSDGDGWNSCDNPSDTSKYPNDKNCTQSRQPCQNCRRVDVNISFNKC